jgi:hypothetical protein
MKYTGVHENDITTHGYHDHSLHETRELPLQLNPGHAA